MGYICMYQVHAWFLKRPEEDVSSQEEQPVLLTAHCCGSQNLFCQSVLVCFSCSFITVFIAVLLASPLKWPSFGGHLKIVSLTSL